MVYPSLCGVKSPHYTLDAYYTTHILHTDTWYTCKSHTTHIPTRYILYTSTWHTCKLHTIYIPHQVHNIYRHTSIHTNHTPDIYYFRHILLADTWYTRKPHTTHSPCAYHTRYIPCYTPYMHTTHTISNIAQIL